MTETRKRLRSEEDSFSLQTKCFVNQQMIEKSDKQLMKKIYGEKSTKIILNNVTNNVKFFRENSQQDLRRSKNSKSKHAKQSKQQQHHERYLNDFGHSR